MLLRKVVYVTEATRFAYGDKIIQYKDDVPSFQMVRQAVSETNTATVISGPAAHLPLIHTL